MCDVSRIRSIGVYTITMWGEGPLKRSRENPVILTQEWRLTAITTAEPSCFRAAFVLAPCFSIHSAERE